MTRYAYQIPQVQSMYNLRDAAHRLVREEHILIKEVQYEVLPGNGYNVRVTFSKIIQGVLCSIYQNKRSTLGKRSGEDYYDIYIGSECVEGDIDNFVKAHKRLHHMASWYIMELLEAEDDG